MFQPPPTMFSVSSSLFLACLPVSLSHTCLHAEYGPSLASPTTTASSCRTTFHFSTSQSPYQPGSQLALPRLTGKLTSACDHVDSSCGLVIWTRQMAARPEINPYQPLLNQLRFPPTIQWVSSRRAPFEPVSSLPTFGMYANLDPTSLALPPNSSLPSHAPT